MRVGIIGTGLIGASIGLAARAAGNEVVGCDIFPFATQMALDSGALDRIGTRDELYAKCELIVIAAHVDGTVEEVRSLRGRRLRDDQLVIDIASVKGPIVRAADGVPAFVATHPMAGGERSGAGAAREDLFRDRAWCYIPTADSARTERARAFIASLGAKPVAIADADEHDDIVALTSHLPQLIAYAFSQRVGEARAQHDPGVFDALCGPTAQELLRLGRSSTQMWNDIFVANGSNVTRESETLEKIIDDHRIPG